MHSIDRAAFFLLFYISNCVGQCPENWTLFQDYCLSFDRVKMSWLDAESTCRTFHGHLVAPSTMNRDLNLEAFLRLQNYKEPIWIDGTDQLEIGYWFWASTGDELSYSKWQPGEPNNPKRSLCVAVIDGDDNWRNRACSDKNAFVCEIKARLLQCGQTNHEKSSEVVTLLTTTTIGQRHIFIQNQGLCQDESKSSSWRNRWIAKCPTRPCPRKK